MSADSACIRKRLVILGVAASDSHAVANHLIAMRLRLDGFVVINLGVCTPLEEFADALDDYPDAEALIIGSLNGHAYEDLKELPALRQAGRLHAPVVLGGNLSVGSEKTEQHLRDLRELGVDHIIEDPDTLTTLLNSLTPAVPASVPGRLHA